jgi:hypothetical protein
VNDGVDRDRDPDKPGTYLAEWPSGKVIRSVNLALNEPDRLDILGLSSDERLLVLKDDSEESLIFWEIATDKVRAKFKPGYSAEYSPDGRLIVIGQGEMKVIIDALTYETVWDLGMRSNAAFSANGKLLVTGQLSSLLVWDARAALPRKTSTEKLTSAQLADLWEELRSDDARAAHRAMIAFSRRPDDAVAFLRSRLPDAPVDAANFKRLLADLDDPKFKTRETAQADMEKLGSIVGGLIRRTLENPPSLEVERRLSAVLEKLVLSQSERVRWLRTSELLERIGTAPAVASHRLLRGFSDAEVAADAARSLERIAAFGK